MKKLDLVQLGDIHLPTAEALVGADVKDTALAPALISATTSDPLTASLTKAVQVSDEVGGALLICGDLTDGADADGYSRAVHRLDAVFQLKSSRDADTVHVTIGNHDLDRGMVPEDDSTEDHRFDFAIDAWKPLDLLPHPEPRSTQVKKDGVSIALTSINSCVGSGQHRSLPEPMRSAFERVVSGVATSSADGETSVVALPFEALDSPAINLEQLDILIKRINRLPSATIPVILAHHSVLPQAEPRFAAYTEMVNGGDVRRRLSSCGRPVIYLHGHIHSDPVEVVTQVHPDPGTLVLVSAPLLTSGFNHVQIQFSDNDRLLGLEVWRYRGRPGSYVVREPEPVRVSLYDRAGQPSPLLLQIAALADSGRQYRFRQLAEELGVLADAQLADAVLEAEWLERLQIADRSGPSDRWIIRMGVL